MEQVEETQNELQPRSENFDEQSVSDGDSTISGGEDLDEIRRSLEEARLLLVRERNIRIFERAAEKAGIRRDRIDAAVKLTGIDVSDETMEETQAEKIAREIAAQYPEFTQNKNPVDVDNGAPGVRLSRAAASGDALEMLKMLLKK
ncbi:hypothetical protein DRQ26_01160 [bacterium]|nr:MAG: hypothetical protein DRQ26_01160 [bacterium]